METGYLAPGPSSSDTSGVQGLWEGAGVSGEELDKPGRRPGSTRAEERLVCRRRRLVSRLTGSAEPQARKRPDQAVSSRRRRTSLLPTLGPWSLPAKEMSVGRAGVPGGVGQGVARTCCSQRGTAEAPTPRLPWLGICWLSGRARPHCRVAVKPPKAFACPFAGQGPSSEAPQGCRAGDRRPPC